MTALDVRADKREPLADQIARVRLMASGSSKWDLSDNDRAALAAVLAEMDGDAVREAAIEWLRTRDAEAHAWALVRHAKDADSRTHRELRDGWIRLDGERIEAQGALERIARPLYLARCEQENDRDRAAAAAEGK